MRGAVIDGEYRYLLWRQWSTKPPVRWVMLNPSTADGDADDATIRKCIGFSRRWGWGGIEVVNLFALRSRDPDQLLLHPHPTGPKNFDYLRDVAAGPVVVGWGSHRFVRQNPGLVALATAAIPGRLECLGKNEDGSPKHPCMLGYNTELEAWR